MLQRSEGRIAALVIMGVGDYEAGRGGGVMRHCELAS